MKVKISIYTDADGKNEVFEQRGELNKLEQGFYLAYSFEGDECRLCAADGQVTQTRSGEFNFKVNFKEGEHTRFIFKEAEKEFSMPIYTRTLSVELLNDGCRITLSYVREGENKPVQVLVLAACEKTRDMKRQPRPKSK